MIRQIFKIILQNKQKFYLDHLLICFHLLIFITIYLFAFIYLLLLLFFEHSLLIMHI